MIEIRPHKNGYDGTHWLRLAPQKGAGQAEMLKVNLGESVVLGRSRSCEWSLKRTDAYLKDQNGSRAEMKQSLAFRSVSRRHCRITYIAPDMVDVENLSPNGTLVDGHRVDRVVLTDCRSKLHTIQLGPAGFTLELAPGALPI
jgi:pSer/pThr/pTyr-binding forkhead associated (FHA) protein